MKPLLEIPNQQGYRFVGITLEQERVPCVVDLNASGCHCVYRESDRRLFWFKLYGWEPLEFYEGSGDPDGSRLGEGNS